MFAVVDVAGTGSVPNTTADLAELISATASQYYAAPLSSRLLRNYSTRIAELVMGCPPEVRVTLSGPVWVGRVRYAELEAERAAVMENPPAMVLRDGRLVAKI